MMSVIVKRDPRQQMIVSAVALMREQGVDAASFSRVLERSGAPRGSIYHHFPEGKAQLVEEATRYAGEFIAAGLAAALQQDDPAAAIRGFAKSWRGLLEKWDFQAGCTVVAAALEGDRSPRARDAARDAFARWEDLLAEAFADRGRARGARSLAVDPHHRRGGGRRGPGSGARARPSRWSGWPTSSPRSWPRRSRRRRRRAR